MAEHRRDDDAAAATAAAEASYVDYEAFLAPDFSPSAFANVLVLATNNPSDTPLDLSTPLSKVLFDAQEVDSHIDSLTTRSALPLLAHTRRQTDASGRIIAEIDSQVKSLNDSYAQLERQVIQKHAEADQVRLVAARLWEALRLGRSVARCLQLGRQLEVQHSETLAGGGAAAAGGVVSAALRKEDHRALVRCANTIVSLREVLDRSAPGEEGHGLERVAAIRALRDGVVAPVEKSVRAAAEQMIREFSLGSASGAATYAQSEETKARTVSAMTTLYLLSPTEGVRPNQWAPTLLLQALEVFLRNSLQSSVASLVRSLSTLPSLDRTLAEIAARCQNIIALEIILETTKAPAHPLLLSQGQSGSTTTTTTAAATIPEKSGNLLQPLLSHLETGSLASYFWRTMASSLPPRVQEIVNRGGVSARTLRSNRSSVADAIRECVNKGSQPPSTMVAAGAGKGSGSGGVAVSAQEKGRWDREVAVMVGSVTGSLGR
ncbi:Golgi transport complex [Microdochium nivale]|nr:Golgi transport complex [Microdochium nivale]